MSDMTSWGARAPLVVGLMILALGSLGVSAFAAQSYNIINLGTIVGGNDSYATAINGSGQVVGNSGTPDGQHAFIHSGGSMSDLGTLGGPSSYATGVNASGNVVGHSRTDAGTYTTHAFIYSGGVMTDLGTLPGGTNSYAKGINASDQVVGSSSTNGTSINHAFLATQSGGGWDLTDLGTLGGGQSSAYAINDAGQVAGQGHVAGDTAAHAFRYSEGALEDIGTLSGHWSSTGYAINASGQVVGSSWGEDYIQRAFLATKSGGGWDLTNLGTLGGSGDETALWSSVATGINASGQVVGWSEVDDWWTAHAFVYSGGVMTDLNSFVAGTDWILTEATAINDAGQIVGIGTYDGETRGFLMNPTPELSSGALLLIGALPVGLAWWRRRRA